MAIQLARAIPVLPVLSIQEALDFYRERLGFGLVFRREGLAGVARDRVQIHFWLTEDASLAKVSACHVYLTGVEELSRELAPHGVIHPNGALQERPWGMLELNVLDCFGNLIVFCEEIARR